MSVRVLALLFLAGTTFAGTHYVDASLASGANDGSSWANAHQGVEGIQAALALAVAGDEIWVAKGTYKPTATLSRTISFELKSGVAIRGGFAGGETLASQAAPAVNTTILSGDLGGNDVAGEFGDNSFHVVRGRPGLFDSILDGFTIQGGNADEAGDFSDRGGALLFVANRGLVRRCVVRGNRSTFGGGAAYLRGSSATIEDCVFENNRCGGGGGAIEVTAGLFDAGHSGATFDRCILRGNSARRGGAFYVAPDFAIARVYNSLIVGNTATGDDGGAGGGGAIWTAAGPTRIVNCTIVENRSLVSNAAGIYSGNPHVLVANCVLDANAGPGGATGALFEVVGMLNIRYTCVADGYIDGVGNFSARPMFVDRDHGDFRLRLGSRLIDAGESSSVAPGVELDLARSTRIVDHPVVGDFNNGPAQPPPRVDIGAYEAQVEPITRYCFGDGAELACPCGNEASGPDLGGCKNSTGVSGKLGGYGVASVSGDSLEFDALFLTGMGPGKALLFQGTRIAQAPFNDGHLCINGTLILIGVKPVAYVLGYVNFPGPGDPSISVAGAVSPGDVRTYQVHYRNAAAFCTAATVNQTNGVAVIWAP